MPLHLRARALHPQIFGGQLVALAIVETDDEGGAIAAKLDLGRPNLARTCPGRTRRRVGGHARSPSRPGRGGEEKYEAGHKLAQAHRLAFVAPPHYIVGRGTPRAVFRPGASNIMSGTMQTTD